MQSQKPKQILNIPIEKFNARTLTPIVSIWVANLVFAIVAIVLISQILEAYANYDVINQELQVTQNKVTLIEANKQLTEAEIDQYNATLNKLIPDEESYFYVITALEKISAASGFKVTQYSINLSFTTEDKLSLSVEGTGDAESFVKLMETYQLGGGRLVTNERMEFFPQNLDRVRVSLNFYHKKAPETVQAGNPLTAQDIEFMDELVEKLKETE